MDFSDLIPGEPTDKSIGININGIETEVPAEVRGLTPEETALVRSKLPTNQWPKAVLDKIEGSARDKLELGLSPFDTDGSQPAPPEHLSAGSGSAISQPSYSPTPRGQDSNDPTDLQGREREGGSMTPDELDRLWQAQQRRNEEARARAMNEVNAGQSIRNEISQVPQRALLAGGPTAASIENASQPLDFSDLVPQQQQGGMFADLIPQLTPDQAAARAYSRTPQAAQELANPEGSPGYQELTTAHALPPGAIPSTGATAPGLDDVLRAATTFGQNEQVEPPRKIETGEPETLDDAYNQGGVLGAAFYPRKISDLAKRDEMLPPPSNSLEAVGHALAGFPYDAADFLTTPQGAATVALGGVGGPLARLGIALGFTADQVKAFIKADTLEDKVKAALGATLSVAGVKGELPSLEALRAPVNAPSMPEARSETDPHAAAKAKAIADMRAEAEAANNPANYPYGSAEKPVQVEPQTAGLQQQETTARVAGQPSGVIYDESGNAYTINEAGQPEQLTPQLTSAKITPDELQKSETNLEGTGPETSAQADASTTNTHDTGISTKNAYTDAQREARGFSEATDEAARDFGSVWSEAEQTDRRDARAGSRLVEAINDGTVKTVSDHDNALLLREQIAAQTEHTEAVNAVNSAKTPDDLTSAKANLAIARDRLQGVYEATRKSGRSLGQGLNARKMLAAEDYSLSAMEARRRAANNGKPLNDSQHAEVRKLHEKIAAFSARIDELEQERLAQERSQYVTENPGIRQGLQEAKVAARSGKRFADFMDEAAQRARQRLIAKRGRLYAGIDPTSIVDETIIGASHIARGLTKFSDWSAQMIKDFGDRIKPYLQDIFAKARAYHDASAKAYRSPEEVKLASYKTRLATQTVGVTAKLERGDFTKPTRNKIELDTSAYKMRANLQRLKNEFERGVAKAAYKNMGKWDKFWTHFVGVERAMKLSSPAVFEKLGLAAGVREAALAPIESYGGYAVSKIFPKLAKGTRYGASLGAVTRAELKAKVALFTQGMKDAWENVKGKETELEAMSDKYGRQPDFWYNRIGKIHAAIKAPIKRAEFVRSLEQRMSSAVEAGWDINHPEVMDRLATESALDANRAIFQQNTKVSNFFSMLDKASPGAGRVARFVQPVIKIPVNIFKELVTYNLGAPSAVAKIGRAYWRGVETLPAPEREAIIRQLVKGSVGGAALLWAFYNRDKVRDFFHNAPSYFEHTPIAMAFQEGSIIADIVAGRKGAVSDLQKMGRYDIPFTYTITDLAGALDPKNPNGWRDYLYSLLLSTAVPQAVSWTAKELDKPTPFDQFERPPYRVPQNIPQAIEQGVPGLRQDVPIHKTKRH